MPSNALVTPTLTSPRLQLVVPTRAHAQAMLDYAIDNRAHLQNWEPAREATFYTLAAQTQRLQDMHAQMAAGAALHRLLICRRSGALLGLCGFTNIVRGPFQACYLGFSLAQIEQGKGLMHEALSCAIEDVFQRLNLHRVMANYRPENLASARLLAGLGFEVEGRARAYLKINGAWADHILSARICPQA